MQITDTEVRDIVRNDAVIGIAPITLPVPEVSALSVTRQVLHWLVPVAGIAAVVLGLIGLTDRKMRFIAQNIVDALAPANAPLVNPEVLKGAIDTGGLQLRARRAAVRPGHARAASPARQRRRERVRRRP